MPVFWSSSPVVLDRIRRDLLGFFFLAVLRWSELFGEGDAAGISAIKVRLVLSNFCWVVLLLALLPAGRGGEGKERSSRGSAVCSGWWGSSRLALRRGAIWSASRRFEVLPWWEPLESALELSPASNKRRRPVNSINKASGCAARQLLPLLSPFSLAGRGGGGRRWGVGLLETVRRRRQRSSAPARWCGVERLSLEELTGRPRWSTVVSSLAASLHLNKQHCFCSCGLAALPRLSAGQGGEGEEKWSGWSESDGSWSGASLGLDRKDVVLLRLQRQLQHLSEASPDQILISTVGYEASILFYNLEIRKSAFWSIQQHAAQDLDCLNWGRCIDVKLWSQDNAITIGTHESSIRGRPGDLIVTAIYEIWTADLEPSKYNFHMAKMQAARCAMNIIEQDASVFTSTGFPWYDDSHGEDAVPVVRVDPMVVDDNTPVVVPQIQWRGPIRLSSVSDIQYLQLNSPLPQVQTPDRPSGEPPAGHQLVWSIEAFEDCVCGTFGSELSADGRSPCGSFCSLQRLHDVLLSSLSQLCFSVHVYLAPFSRAMLYCDP